MRGVNINVSALSGVERADVKDGVCPYHVAHDGGPILGKSSVRRASWAAQEEDRLWETVG